MYIHNTTDIILYMKDFTKDIGLHIIELTNYTWHHITQHIILSKCSPHRSQMTLITVPSCHTQQSDYGHSSTNIR